MKAIDKDKAFVIEQSATSSPRSMIIMHPKHGRMYITEGFCNNLGYYTWGDGLAAFVKEGDTIESLSDDWNEYATHLEAILHAYDPERPICDWPNYMIENIAIAAIKNTAS